jgi:hypothetical protein
MLLGREAECAALDRIAVQTAGGTSQATILRGDAGVGKTALLEYLIARAAGCRVLRVVGVKSEIELPYSGLHQLCAPVMGLVDRLPFHSRWR